MQHFSSGGPVKLQRNRIFLIEHKLGLISIPFACHTNENTNFGLKVKDET